MNIDVTTEFVIPRQYLPIKPDVGFNDAIIFIKEVFVDMIVESHRKKVEEYAGHPYEQGYIDNYNFCKDVFWIYIGKSIDDESIVETLMSRIEVPDKLADPLCFMESSQYIFDQITNYAKCAILNLTLDKMAEGNLSEKDDFVRKLICGLKWNFSDIASERSLTSV